MKVYVAHSASIDYQNMIYKPLKSEVFPNQCEMIFPHDGVDNVMNSRGDYRGIDVVIAECSEPSTGMGIELGWFYDDKVPIFGFYRAGTEPSDAIKVVAKGMIEYIDEGDFVKKVKNIIKLSI